jgi:uncharacterized membrane protein
LGNHDSLPRIGGASNPPEQFGIPILKDIAVSLGILVGLAMFIYGLLPKANYKITILGIIITGLILSIMTTEGGTHFDCKMNPKEGESKCNFISDDKAYWN